MRMSETEAIMWTVDKDPALRSDFTNVTILDGRPDEPRVRAKVEAALEDIVRLRQRVVTPPLRIAPPEWCDDPTLDLEYHFRKVALPAPGGMRELLDLAASMSATPLDRSRPLWEFTLVEGLVGGRAALLLRIHHTITDGVGGLKLSLALVDFEPDPVETDGSTIHELNVEVKAEQRAQRVADPLKRTGPVDVLTDAVGWATRRTFDMIRRTASSAANLVRHPTSAPTQAADAAALFASIRRQVLVTDRGHSPVFMTRSLSRRYERFQVPLDDATEAAHRLGGSLNDLFVTGVAGALGLYHERMGVPVEELRMAMPVNLRSGESDDANQFAPTRILVPTGPKDPTARFAATRVALADVRAEPALGALSSLTSVIAGLPTAVLVNLTRSQAATIDFATSNLRGSPVPLYVGGAKIEASFPMGPRSGVPLNVTLMSYCGSLDMGINLDPVAITDPAALLSALDESFGALLSAS